MAIDISVRKVESVDDAKRAIEEICEKAITKPVIDTMDAGIDGFDTSIFHYPDEMQVLLDKIKLVEDKLNEFINSVRGL